MASGSTSYLAVPMFTGENYQIWVVKMKSYLKSIRLWDAVETGRDPPPLRVNPTIAQMKQYEEELLKKDKALSVLHSALADHVFTGIMALETAKEVWDQLKEQNEGSDRVKAVRLLTLKREFENLKMKEAETIKVYSSKVMELVNQMRLLGEVIEQHKIVEKMIISLPEKFEAKVSAIEESHDLKKLTVVELISKLQVQEQRTSVRSESQTEGAFQAKHSSRSFNSKDDKRVFGDKSHRGKVVEAEQRELGKGRFPPCSHCKKTNHHETSCWKKAQCRVCKKIGHIAKYYKLKRQQNQHFSPQQTDQKQQANVMEEKQPEDHIFMAVLSSEAPDKHSWLLDSGCTNHMTSNSEYFSTLDTTIRVPVRLRNEDVIESAGKGTISIPTSKGIKFINDVLLVPNLDQNLLSVGQMMHKGYYLFFKDKACVISDSSGDKVVVVPMIDKSFIIRWHSNISLACKTVVDESWLWHKRCNVAVIDPSNFSEASNHEEWNVAMRDEIVVIEKNKTWELVDRPLHKQVVGVKWVYRTKFNADGSIHKHKARLVVKGYAQQQGIDYGDTFAPVARLDTIKLLIALAAQNRWKIFHLDIKSAFLNGYLKEEIFIEQPEGFKVNGEEDKVYKLNKALYGLKQAPRAWYSKIDEFLCASGFRRSCNDATLYIKTSAFADTLIISMDFVSQQAYVINMLKKFRMQHCKPTSTPLIVNQKLTKFDGDTKADAFRYRSLVGSLLYLSAIRPDIMFATSLLSRFMQNPSQVHFGAGRRVLRYLKGTHDLGILFKPEAELNLFGYVDSDWAGCIDDGKSTLGYAFSVGSGMFSWCSKKQDVVAQSTAEAEFIATAAGANQCIWLRKMLIDLGFGQINASPIFCDSKSAIAIAKNPVQHGKTKHMKVKFHFLREAERDQEVCLIHCKSKEQVADILTKALPKTRFEKLREKLGVSKQNLKEEC
ncbi:Retrovirus-related Pol polyprotein from transposon TNT 1-94 [Melia azedarach]|uniref:Retrovirus-related Pol polyprotein from transposon TNT 1-94 n=1 Tax=Melia azedarach TaxID=155640 RepID=A0ACC1XID9_MELAZ|nr:Retrovirus-related Pol polyprotein from transposon TNT 1-94 [Melia azedarach]